MKYVLHPKLSTFNFKLETFNFQLEFSLSVSLAKKGGGTLHTAPIFWEAYMV